MVAYYGVSHCKIFPKLFDPKRISGWDAGVNRRPHDELSFVSHTRQTMAAPKITRFVNYVVVLVLSVTALKALYSLYHVVTTSAPDFMYYYEAALTLRGSAQRHLLPPASVLVYMPLGIFPYEISQGLWILVSAASLVATIWIVGASVGITEKKSLFLITALSYLSFPTQFTLGMGQVNLLVLLLLVVSVRFKHARHSLWAGISFALALLLKPEVMLIAPVFFLYRKWRMLAVTVLVIALTFLVSIGIFGIGAYGTYAERLGGLLTGWRDTDIYYNQSLAGLIARGGGTAGWYVLFSTLVLGTSVYVFWKKRVLFPDIIWKSLPIFILVEPIAWQHHFVFLIPTYIWLWVKHAPFLVRMMLAISYLLVSWNFASSGFLATMPLGWLLASHATVGAILLWFVSLI